MTVDSQGYLDWAIKAPGPAAKGRYPDDPERAMSEILYIVLHDASGWEDFLRQGHRPGEEASWTFSNCQDGDFYQHYPLSALTWTSGGYTANRDGLACENEGVPGQPFNALQVENIRRMRRDVATVCPNLRPPLLGAGFREHGELTQGATQCPSGRAAPVYASYLIAEKEEDVDVDQHHEKVKQLIINSDNNSAKRDTAIDAHGDTRDKALTAQIEALSVKLDTAPAVSLSELDYDALARSILKVANE